MYDHIKTVLTHFKGRVDEWDLLNEPLDDAGKGKLRETIWKRVFGAGYPGDLFKFAHSVDPHVKLCIN